MPRARLINLQSLYAPRKNHTYMNSKPFEGALIIKGEEFIDSLRSYNNKCGEIYILTL